MPEPIPIVDLSRLSSTDDGADHEAAKLLSALQNWGLFLEYGNDMVLSEDQVLDWCGRLYFIVERESRIVRSLWPAKPPAFTHVLREYTARCREIAGAVLASLLGLGLHSDASVITVVLIDDVFGGLQEGDKEALIKGVDDMLKIAIQLLTKSRQVAVLTNLLQDTTTDDDQEQDRAR